MIYILAGLLLFLFFLSYFWGGRDLFAPMTVQAMSFVFSAVMCFYYMWSFEAPYSFHFNSIMIIASCITLSVVIGILAHQFFIRIKIQSKVQEEITISPIPIGISIIALAFISFVIIWQVVVVRHIGGTAGSFVDSMYRFHILGYSSTTGEYDLPFILRQFVVLVEAIFVLYGFDLIRFFKGFSLHEKIIHIVVVGLCILNGLMSGARGYVVYHLLACVMLFHLLRIQKEGRYKKYSFRFLIRMIVIICAFLWAFAAVKTFVGRDAGPLTNPLDYISYYTGTEFITFDKYLQDLPSSSNIVGKESFYSLNHNLRNLGILDIPRYVGHLEFRSVGGGLVTNVYTSFRSYHNDFGIAGVYILHTIASIFMSVFYEYSKKRRGNIEIITFSLMYYSIVLSFFAERFFSTVVSISFLKELISLLILYEFFIRKRVHFIVHSKQRQHSDVFLNDRMYDRTLPDMAGSIRK